MEALVVAIAALVALVIVEAGYSMAVSLVRWSPIIVVGALTGWFASRQGFSPMEAVAIGVFTMAIARLAKRRPLEGT